MFVLFKENYDLCTCIFQNVKNHMEVIHEREINMSLKASETVREVEADNPALEKKRVARWEN